MAVEPDESIDDIVRRNLADENRVIRALLEAKERECEGLRGVVADLEMAHFKLSNKYATLVENLGD